MLEGEVPKPTLAQLDHYLQENRRSAHSLLGAARVTQDRALLHEAMLRYPNDPLVQYAAYFFATDYNPDAVATPERRKWLEALKTSDAENALPDLLSARDYFKAGQTGKALDELRTACAKPRLDDHIMEYIQDAEEAYLAAGEPEISAKAAALFALPLPHLAQLRDLSRSVVDLAHSYRQAGDTESAVAALQYGLAMTDHMGTGQKCLIQDLVAIAIERNVLSAMEPSAVFGDSGQTVQERLALLNQRRDTLKGIGQKSEALMKLMSEQDMVSYIDRWKMFGEESALNWAVAKYDR
jgi:hypothetical protein